MLRLSDRRRKRRKRFVSQGDVPGSVRNGWKKVDSESAVMTCNAGRRGYMKRTSLCEMKENSVGTRMHVFESSQSAIWPAGVASSIDLPSLEFTTRYSPISVNGNAVVSKRGYPCET